MAKKNDKRKLNKNDSSGKVGGKKDEKSKGRLMEKFTEMLELPKEIVLNIPKITIVGNGDMIIENYKGIIEYSDARIRINTGIGTIRMNGSGLVIREITSEDIIISGEIQALEFIR